MSSAVDIYTYYTHFVLCNLNWKGNDSLLETERTFKFKNIKLLDDEDQDAVFEHKERGQTSFCALRHYKTETKETIEGSWWADDFSGSNRKLHEDRRWLHYPSLSQMHETLLTHPSPKYGGWNTCIKVSQAWLQQQNLCDLHKAHYKNIHYKSYIHISSVICSLLSVMINFHR